MKRLNAATVETALELIKIVGTETPSAVLVVEVRTVAWTPAPRGWTAGPLPITQVANATSRQRGHNATTNERARRTLVADAQSDALYGRNGASIRCHRLVGGPVAHRGPILALELLQGPSELTVDGKFIGWLAVHVAVPDQPSNRQRVMLGHRAMMADAVRGANRFDHSLWTTVNELLPGDVWLREGGHVRTLSYQTLDNARKARRCHRKRDGSNIQERSLIAAYLLITSATANNVRDISRRALRHSLTVDRRDWGALVLREGASFVAHQRSVEPFNDVLRVQTHTIHLDAMLMALIQRRMVDASGGLTVKASLDDPTELVALERRHFDFKRTYWRTSLTVKRNSPSDEILRAFQTELLTALDVADVQERVRDGAQLARSLNAERRNRGQQKLTHLVQNATIIFGALGLTFGAAPVVADPSWQLFGLAAGVGVLAMTLAFLILHRTRRRTRSIESESAHP